MAAKDDELRQKLMKVTSEARDPDGAKNALGMLFLRADHALGTAVFHGDQDKRDWKRMRRIADLESAYEYFALTGDLTSWTKDDTSNFLATNPKQAFERLAAHLESISPTAQIRVRRRVLDDLVRAFEPQQFDENWLVAFADNTSLFVGDDLLLNVGFYYLDNIGRLRIIVTEALRALPESSRASLLTRAIRRAHDFTLLSDVVRGLAGDVRKEGARQDRSEIGLGEYRDQVRDRLITKVRSIARRGAFWRQAIPREVLWFWWGLGLDGEIRHFAQHEMRRREGIVGLARSALSRVISSTEGGYLVVDKEIGQFVDLSKLSDQVARISHASDLSEDERLVLDAYRTAMERADN